MDGWSLVVVSCPKAFCSHVNNQSHTDLGVCVKVILLQMELITSTDVVRNLCKKMAPPLVTLLSAEPEIQYVALRNINLIVQRRPGILAHEIKVHTESPFFAITASIAGVFRGTSVACFSCIELMN